MESGTTVETITLFPFLILNKKRTAKSVGLVLSTNNGGLPRYVLNQENIFVPVGKEIKIVTPVK